MNGAHDTPGLLAYRPSLDGLHSDNIAEFNATMLKLADSDYVDTDWLGLRQIVKHKLYENVAEYMADPPPPPPPPASAEPQLSSPDSAATTLSPRSLSHNGPKFPPFPRREVDKFVRRDFNSHERSKTVLTEEEVGGALANIWRLLDDYGGHPPFTIQRVCELLVRPRTHYKNVGKYLRAFERALLVTSTIDAFPVIPPEDPLLATPLHTFSPTGSLREATTPLFSPIPFLHEDARSRSRSHSPQMSPLQLAGTGRSLSPGAEDFRLGGAAAVAVVDPVSVDSLAVEGGPVIDGPVIGLVDELDDPSPGHMSDHPTALTVTTSTTSEPSASVTPVVASTPRPVGKPMFGGSLQERFVKSSSTEETPAEGQAPITTPLDSEDGDAMAVDEPDADKENINDG